MKNLIKIVLVMFMVNVAAKTTYAQTGTGFFPPQYEYTTHRQAIKDGFKSIMIPAFGIGDFSGFARTSNQTKTVAPVVIFSAIKEHLKQGIGRNITGAEIASMLRGGIINGGDYLEFVPVGPEYWNTHKNAYFSVNGGLDWWDPRTSSIPEFRNRKEWIIARFHINGVIREIVANCGNLVKEDNVNTNNGDEHPDQQYAASQYAAPVQQVVVAPAPNISIVVQQPDRFADLNAAAATKNTGIPTYVKVGIAVVVVAVLVKCVLIPALTNHKKDDAGKDGGVRDTNWQDGSTSPWPQQPGAPATGQQF